MRVYKERGSVPEVCTVYARLVVVVLYLCTLILFCVCCHKKTEETDMSWMDLLSLGISIVAFEGCYKSGRAIETACLSKLA